MARKWLPRSWRRSHLVAAACLALALGGIVLARAQGFVRTPGDVRPGRRPTPGVTGSRIPLNGAGLSGFAALSQTAVLAGGTRQLFAELRLVGDAQSAQAHRTPVALAVVLDHSGSMSGDKIRQARESVVSLLEQMQPDDRIAIVVYDDTAEVLQPLARVGAVRAELETRVRAVEADGGTMIPQALELGARALAEAGAEFARRLVLVSDGLDGSGQSAQQIASAVRTRSEAGLTTSTLGIGTDYDERYMTSVADAGRGTYGFLANADQLRAFLARELDAAAHTVADDVVASLDLPAGWRLVRVYGAEASGTRIPVGTVYGGERRKVVVELEVAAGSAGDAGALGVNVAWRATATAERNRAGGHLGLHVLDDATAVGASRDAELYADAMATAVDTRQADAIEAWRGGNAEEAAHLAAQNVAALRALQQVAPSANAAARIGEFEQDIGNFRAQSAGSEGGRAYGLHGNAARRERAASF